MGRKLGTLWAAALTLASAVAIISSDAGAQSIIPVVTISVEPLTAEVDASAGAAQAVFNCTVFVDGIPYVRYRVNLTAECEGWEAACDPSSFVVSGNGTNSYHATVKVPPGSPGGQTKYLTLNATVSTTGVSLATCTTYAVVATRQSFGLNLTTTTTDIAVTAGKTASWPFGLKNNGNGRDTFSLSVVNLQSYTSNGWVVKFNRSLLSVDAGDTGLCTINITPAEGSKNQTASFEIKAYSKGASYQNITIETTLALQLTVKAAPAGGGNGKTTPPKATPGMEVMWLVAAIAIAGLAGGLNRSSKRG